MIKENTLIVNGSAGARRHQQFAAGRQTINEYRDRMRVWSGAEDHIRARKFLQFSYDVRPAMIVDKHDYRPTSLFLGIPNPD